jgi:hypothetical protein
MSPILQTASARLNKAAIDLTGHAQFVESGLGDTPLQDYITTLQQPAMVYQPDGLTIALLGLSPNAVAKTLSVWLGADYFSCRTLIPSHSACFDLNASSSSAWALVTKEAVRSCESLGSLVGVIEQAERGVSEARSALDRPQIQVPAPEGCEGLRLLVPANTEVLRKHGALSSWMGDQAQLVILVGHADDALDQPTLEAIQPIVSAVGALRCVSLSPEDTGVPVWAQMLNAPLQMPLCHFVDAKPFALLGGSFDIAVLREFGRMRQIEGACHMVNDELSSDTTSAQNRKRLNDPSRAAVTLSVNDANPRNLAERVMKPFIRDLEDIRKNRDDEAARAIGTEGSLYAAAQRLVERTQFEDLRQEMLNHTIKLSLSAATLERLRNVVRQEMNRNLREDLAILEEAIYSGLEPLESSLQSSTGYTHRISPPSPDSERLCESLSALVQLNIRYKGEIPRATWKTRFQGARNWMMGVSMFLMLSSGLGVMLGRDAQTSIRSALLLLMLFAFIAGLIAAIFGYKRVRAEAIEREMDKLRDAVMQEVSRLFSNLLTEKRRLLAEHLQRIQREVESEVNRIFQGQSDDSRQQSDRARAEATERNRIMDNELRTIAQTQLACRSIFGEIAQVQLQLGQTLLEAKRGPANSPRTSTASKFERPAIPPSGPNRQPPPAQAPAFPSPQAPSPLDHFTLPQAAPQVID